MLYRAQAVIVRTPNGVVEDVAVNTYTLIGADGGVDAEQIAIKVAGLYSGTGGVAALMHNSHVLDRVKVYAGTAAGPPLFDHNVNVPGGQASGLLPLQVATSVTFKTAARKRWGRVYIPGIAWNSYEANTGLLTAGAIDYLAEKFAAWSDGIDGLTLAGLTHVTTSADSSSPGEVTSPVLHYQVDNVPDVIRSRRAQAGILRNSKPSRD